MRRRQISRLGRARLQRHCRSIGRAKELPHSGLQVRPYPLLLFALAPRPRPMAEFDFGQRTMVRLEGQRRETAAARAAHANERVAARSTQVVRLKAGERLPEETDEVAVEEPLEIRVEGQSVAVVMRLSGIAPFGMVDVLAPR